MTHEDLIERARLAFVDAWEGVNDNVPAAERAPGARSRAGIEAAFAVFESAHAPTDDEREALALIVARATREARAVDILGVADAILAAGFRRSGVPEPSVEEWTARIIAAREEAIAKGYTPEHDAEHGIRHLLNWAIDYARRGRAEESSGLILSAKALLDAEPQGEPSECSNPDCPLERAHSGPCAPKDWQGEPSDAQEECGATPRKWLDNWEYHPCKLPKGHPGDHEAETLTWARGETVKDGVILNPNRPEPPFPGRGEPSTAQVKAAVQAWVDSFGPDDEEAMRAALRAAGVVGQEGEKR